MLGFTFALFNFRTRLSFSSLLKQRRRNESPPLLTPSVSDDRAQFRRHRHHSVVESVCQRSIVIPPARTCHRGLVVSFSRFGSRFGSPFCFVFCFFARMLARRENTRSPRECTTVASFHFPRMNMPRLMSACGTQHMSESCVRACVCVYWILLMVLHSFSSDQCAPLL